MKKSRIWWPLVAALAAIAVDIWLPNSARQPAAKHPYLLYVLVAVAGGSAFLAVASLCSAALRGKLEYKSAFYTTVIVLLTIFNVATKKFSLLPAIFFPAPDRILAVLATGWSYLLIECLGSSAKLLFSGYLIGAVCGLVTGVAVGFSRGIGYWVNPLVRILGPIPPTAWIPIVLVAFPTTFLSGVFLIALAVWFPTTVMTASGIANVPNAFFEVSSTLGASRRYQIFHVGIPAAMPFIFIGLFTGACSSFITLMTAEMLGVKNGIGWYVNWQREMMSYANVYAGLIVIAAGFYILITLLFKLRDRVLVWQKGVIKW